MLKISKAGKMPCPSWSLQARETCPGAIDPNTSKPVPACDKCYALRGNYGFKAVKAARAYNREDWKRDSFVSEFIIFLQDYCYFRWFDSGDCYHPALAEKIYLIMQATPWCKHWLPTQAYRIPKLRVWFDKMQALPNAMVRFSSPNVNGEYTKGLHGSVIVPNANVSTDATLCNAPSNNGKCGDCRACWDKSKPVIAYVKH